MTNIKELEELGFEKSAIWILDGSSIICEITRNGDREKVLYAFIENEKVKYIGKTNKKLSQRMDGYRHPGPSQRTNIRIKQKIIDSLSAGNTVAVYVLNPKKEILYCNIPVNIAAGLEDSLIERLKPDWNMIGKI